MLKNKLTLLLTLLSCIVNILTITAQTPSDKPCNAPLIVASGTPGVPINYSFTVCCMDSSYRNFLGKQPACGNSGTNQDAWFKIGGMTAGEEYNFLYTETAHRQTWVEIYELPLGKDCKDPSNYIAISCSRQNDVDYFPQSTASATFVPTNASSTYYVRLMRYRIFQLNGLEGTISITKSYVNDLPCGAILLPVQPAEGTSPVIGQNFVAATWTPQGFNNILCGPNNDIWYKFIPEECSINISLKNLSPTSYEMQAAILESVDGTCNNLKAVTACGGIKDKFNDILLSADGLTVGKTYYVIVDGFSPPYANATGKHSIEVFKKPNAPICPNITTPCDCSKPTGCSSPMPFATPALGNLALNKAKADGTVNGCFDLTAQKIPLIGGTNKAEFCANYTAAPGDDFMAFDNVVHKDASCSLLANLSKNVVYEAGDCSKPILPTCKDVNGVSPVYRLTAGKTYKFCRQVVADGGDVDCVGKNYQAFCAFLWKINNKTTINQTICNGSVYGFNGQNYDKTGTYTGTFPNAVTGCDSIVTLNLTVLPKLTSVLTPPPVCPEKGYVIEGVTYTVTGSFPVTIKSVNGCDSTITLNLTVLPKKETSITKTLCNKETVTIGASTYSQSGIYTTKVKASNGCDSTVTLNLTVLGFIGKEYNETVCFGGKYTFKGKDYTQTGVYELEKFKAKNGCDSIIQLNLTVLPDYSDVKVEKTICSGQTYPFGDKILNTAGVYSYAFKSKYLGLNCDSMVTLTLKLDNRLESSLIKSLCFGESITIGGVVYNTTIKKDIALKAIGGGCDSIIKLDLTVRPEPTKITERDTICDGDFIEFGGQKLTKEGTYLNSIKSKAGCDSLITTKIIKVVRPDTTIITGYLCKGAFVYEGTTYTQIGVYSYIFKSKAGCAIKSVTIIVKEKDIPAEVKVTKNESCSGKCDAEATVTGVKDAAAYLWNNGANTATITNLCSGEYTVTVTDKDGCTVVRKITISTNPPAFNVVPTTTPSCVGGKSGAISVGVFPPNPDYTYLWSTGAKTSSIDKLAAGTYKVTVYDKEGCNVNKEITVSENKDAYTVSISEKDTIVEGQSTSVTLVTTPSGNATFTWDPKSSVSNGSISTVFNLAPQITTLYSVTATDANGCVAVTNHTVYVKTIDFPTIFTPESGDVNGKFEPSNIIEGVGITKLIIFDRWGNLVYDYEKLAVKDWWNGKMNNTGEDLASDVYVYVVEYKILISKTAGTPEFKMFKKPPGNITLIR